MKFLLAPDSFKGSLDQIVVCATMHAAIEEFLPGADVVEFPLSDGGDGFGKVLSHHCKARREKVRVEDPLGREVLAEYLLLETGEAVIEVASACGLQRLEPHELNPLGASSFGVGQLIRAATEHGCKKMIIGLGGSATNDGGAGMLAALGFGLLDEQGESIPRGAAGLMKLHRIDTQHALAGLDDVEKLLASDVQNPLLGPAGASRTFGPQKGASEDTVEELEAALSRFNDVIISTVGCSMADTPGAGAAGGIGAALMAFAAASYRPGFEVVVGLTGLEKQLVHDKPDLIITAEGCLDGQTGKGKLPLGVARLAAQYQVPLAVIAGEIKLNDPEVKAMGFDYWAALAGESVSVNEAIQNAPKYLSMATEKVIKGFLAEARYD